MAEQKKQFTILVKTTDAAMLQVVALMHSGIAVLAMPNPGKDGGWFVAVSNETAPHYGKPASSKHFSRVLSETDILDTFSENARAEF